MNDLSSNYINPWESVNHRTVPSFKIDHNLSSKDKLTFFWSRTKTWNPNSYAFADGIPTAVTITRNTDVTADTVRLGFDHNLTPTSLVHLGVGSMTMSFGDINTNTGLSPRSGIIVARISF